MAIGQDLPARAVGSALFADISGFTPLTEALAQVFGPRRGVEELTGHLNRVYDALIAEVHARRGSVINFAGDAITCWFDGDSGIRAVRCGLGMQAAMAAQPEVEVGSGSPVTLSLKVGIAAGEARRFAVGDPLIQRLDVLAGAVTAEMAAVAAVAAKGEVLVSESLALSQPGAFRLGGWRAFSGGRCAAVVEAVGGAAMLRWRDLPSFPEEAIRPWLLPAVFDRLHGGMGEFLTELRPAVALFLKFGGIDYDNDPDAGRKLDAFVRWVQRVVTSLGGYLHHVSIGDKGSYLYCAFGAPVANEDDAQRCLTAALQLRAPPADLGFDPRPQVGISQGTMRTGAYGGTARRTYGVLGDEVNVAARLMEHAGTGEVLVSGRTRDAAGDAFVWQPVLPLSLKGKAQSVAVFRLEDRRADDGMELTEPAHATPMVGRVAERTRIVEKLRLARDGAGQLIWIVAEAGMGKSRLVEEAVREARQLGFQALGGQAQSVGTNTSYLAWWGIWRAFFYLARGGRMEEHAATLAGQLLEMNPAFLPRLPLLGAVLNIAFPENDTTRSLDAKLRKVSLENLLQECLRHRAQRAPLLIVLEDGHWLDPLSRDLLQALAGSIAFLPVAILVATRPSGPEEGVAGRMANLPYSTVLRLGELSAAESEELIQRKLAELSGSAAVTPDPTVVKRLMERSQGNPFYLEELINFLRGEGLDPNDAKAWERLELPSSLHSLILSRVDRLPERQKPTLKVASVIGRVFEPGMISAIHPSLTEMAVREDLMDFQRRELTAMERPEPRLAFIFKHVVTQEVAYETLPFATRARLHGALGAFLESQPGDAASAQIDLIAFHYDRSDNDAKRREYLRKAAEAAQARYANEAAISYYRRLLPLLTPAERIDPEINLGRVLETTGDWVGAAEAYRAATRNAVEVADGLAEARARTALAELHRKQGNYPEATEELDRARELFAGVGDELGVAQTLHYAGSVAAQQGDYEKARSLYNRSLETRRRREDWPGVASLLSNLGIIAWFQGEFQDARRLYEESLAIRRRLGSRWAIGNSLNNLGLVLRDLGDAAGARRLLEECVAINRELGDRWSVANALASLADVALSQGDHTSARDFLVENARINREVGDKTGLAFSLELFAQLAAARGEARRALRLVGAALELRESIGAPLSPSERERLDRALKSATAGLASGLRDVFLSEGRGLSAEEAVAYALSEEGTAA